MVIGFLSLFSVWFWFDMEEIQRWHTKPYELSDSRWGAGRFWQQPPRYITRSPKMCFAVFNDAMNTMVPAQRWQTGLDVRGFCRLKKLIARQWNQKKSAFVVGTPIAGNIVFHPKFFKNNGLGKKLMENFFSTGLPNQVATHSWEETSNLN